MDGFLLFCWLLLTTLNSSPIDLRGAATSNKYLNIKNKIYLLLFLIPVRWSNIIYPGARYLCELLIFYASKCTKDLDLRGIYTNIFSPVIDNYFLRLKLYNTLFITYIYTILHIFFR